MEGVGKWNTSILSINYFCKFTHLFSYSLISNYMNKVIFSHLKINKWKGLEKSKVLEKIQKLIIGEGSNYLVHRSSKKVLQHSFESKN